MANLYAFFDFQTVFVVMARTEPDALQKITENNPDFKPRGAGHKIVGPVFKIDTDGFSDTAHYGGIDLRKK